MTKQAEASIYPSNAIDIIESGPLKGPFFYCLYVAARWDGVEWLPGWLERPAPRLERKELTPLEETLVSIASPVAETLGFDLVRVRVTGSGEQTVQVMAERPDKTMSAEDCARLSRALSPVLEEADPIAGAYVLEVSSPGIDRPLTRFSDFEDWQGYEAKIEIDRLIEGRKRFRGVLAGTDENNVCIDMDGEDQTALIPYDWVVTAKLVLSDQLMRESLAAAKAEQKAGLLQQPPEEKEEITDFSEMETTHDK